MTRSTILLVEDSSPDARLIRYAIETTRWGEYRVLTGTTLAEARELLVNERVDAIVADLGLPDAEGLEAVYALRAVAPQTPLVVLTVHDEPDLATAALEAGADDCQTKARLDGDGIGRALKYAILRRQADIEREALRAKEAELAKLKEVDGIRRDLVRLIAHELRTPMTPLVLWLDILEKEITSTTPPAQRHAILNAKRSSARLHRLINDVVQAAQASAVGLTIRPKDMHLDALVHEAIAEQAPIAMARRVHVEPRVQSPLRIQGDADKLHSALHAVLSNAIKYSEEKGRIEVAASRDGANVILTVRDEGAGIPAETLPRLFQPFGVGSDVLATPTDARGLGLYLARVVVEGHGGRIWAQSRGPGTGTTIRIELPGGEPHA